MRITDNVHVREFEALLPPRALKAELPLTDAISTTVANARDAVRRVLVGQDDRLVVVVGPCSVHDTAAALEYAGRLRDVQHRLADRLLILMRVYLEKPRTTTGWRGLLNDPLLDGSYDMNEGLRRSREVLLRVTELGVPVATEMLDPISPQYMSDIISLAAIGARTVESQTHRALASGVSMPVGYKNGTGGSIQIAVNAVVSAASSHSFLGIDQDGQSAIVRTLGNPDGFVILRGSRFGPNYAPEHIAETERLMQAAALRPAIMVDCSHANSGSDERRQAEVWDAVLRQRREHPGTIMGMMLESNLFSGKQPLVADHTQLRYGVSITDGCIGWDETVTLLDRAHAALG